MSPFSCVLRDGLTLFILPHTAVGMRAQPQQPWGSGTLFVLLAHAGDIPFLLEHENEKG